MDKLYYWIIGGVVLLVGLLVFVYFYFFKSNNNKQVRFQDQSRLPYGAVPQRYQQPLPSRIPAGQVPVSTSVQGYEALRMRDGEQPPGGGYGAPAQGGYGAMDPGNDSENDGVSDAFKSSGIPPGMEYVKET